jgi:hypothetical protein
MRDDKQARMLYNLVLDQAPQGHKIFVLEWQKINVVHVALDKKEEKNLSSVYKSI